MGGFSRRRSTGLAGFEMIRAFRLLAYLAIGLLLGGSATFAFAGYAQLKPPANIGGTVGARVSAGAFAANAGNISVGFTTQVAGRTVTVPATMRFAANAGQVIGTAARLNPTALILGSLAAYLLQQGYEMLNGQMVKRVAGPESCLTNCFYYTARAATGATSPPMPSPQAAVDWVESLMAVPYAHFAPLVFYEITETSYKVNRMGTIYWYQGSVTKGQPRPADEPLTEPVTDEDLARLPVPNDDAAEEAAARGVPVPLQDPQFDPTPQNIPLSNPYPKPGGQPGETVRDSVRVTPAPNEQVKIEPVVEPVTGPNGVPITPTNPDGSTNPDAAPEDKPDFCIENPDALACWKEGEPENAELEKVTAGTSITPVNIGGGGSCPASKTVNYMGANLVISFTPICTAAGWINPIVLALAWLSAGFILIGAFKQG